MFGSYYRACGDVAPSTFDGGVPYRCTRRNRHYGMHWAGNDAVIGGVKDSWPRREDVAEATRLARAAGWGAWGGASA